MSAHNPINDTLGASIANKFGLGGGFTTMMFGWVTAADLAVYVGMIATLVGLIASLYFQRVKHSREKQAHESEEKRKQEEERRRQELHEARLLYYTRGGTSVVEGDVDND